MDGIYLVREKRREPLWERIERLRVDIALYTGVFVVVTAATLAAIFGTAAVLVWLFFGAQAGRFGDSFFLLWVSGVPRVYMIVFAAGAVLASVWATFALLRSHHWLVRRLDATRVPKGEMMDTKMALKDMAIAAGLPVAPELFVIPTDNVNAFVHTSGRRRPIVGVTRGMAERMPQREQRAVFANLVARLVGGSAARAAALCSLMDPLNAMRDATLPDDERVAFDDDGELSPGIASSDALTAIAAFWPFMMLFAGGLIVTGELAAAAQREGQLRAAEKADAEGMLLLKDPSSMLSALDRAVRLNNYVPGAEAGLADLFFCWSGWESTDDEEDPEWRRVSRLREVLGAEGVDLRDVPIGT
ncbi:MAG: hypothetical protein HY876_05260 [Coriobacteriales bacterium]|nr:hypothetical protein [Coriobacteriales bacterium]